MDTSLTPTQVAMSFKASSVPLQKELAGGIIPGLGDAMSGHLKKAKITKVCQVLAIWLELGCDETAFVEKIQQLCGGASHAHGPDCKQIHAAFKDKFSGTVNYN